MDLIASASLGANLALRGTSNDESPIGNCAKLLI